MSNHYQQHPQSDDRQHRGLGNPSEPFSNTKSQELYDAAARGYRAMLTPEGKLNDIDWIRKADHGQGHVLLHSDSDGGGVLRTRTGLRNRLSDEGRAVRAVHAGTDDHSRQESSRYKCDSYNSKSGLASPCLATTNNKGYTACCSLIEGHEREHMDPIGACEWDDVDGGMMIIAYMVIGMIMLILSGVVFGIKHLVAVAR
jgi:hypothetical protein